MIERKSLMSHKESIDRKILLGLENQIDDLRVKQMVSGKRGIYFKPDR